MTFTHLHTHSRASILKSSIDVDALVARAKELNMGAIALTDYNNLFNIIPFYKTCHQNNIKPILGIELNITNDCAESIQLKIKDTSSIVLLAENNAGWRNIIKLHNIANDNEHFYYTPRIDLNLLEQYREGVIVLTGSNNGIINSLLTIDVNGHISNDFKASAMIRRLLTFLDKDHLYIEVQDFNNTNTLELNKKLRQLALKYGLSTVATNDIHYLHKADAEAHKTLRTMSEFQHAKISGSTFETDEYYLKSRKEMETNEFSDIKGSDLFCSELDITNTIAERCNVSIDLKRNRLPSYPYTPAGKTGIQFLREKVFSNPMKWTQEYLNRAEKELVDIEALGFADYFLLVADVIGWAKQQDILTGPGRGSVGGSLVSYALGITNIDPIKNGLIWERFLNIGRKSLPDIDSDFQRSRRGEVIDYIKERFGNNKVTQLVTFNKLAARAVLKEVFRTYGMPFDEANKITSLLPLKNDEHTQITLDEAISMVPELQVYEQKYRAWFSIARSLEGCYKSIGTHAAAVVISNEDFANGEYPLCRSADSKSLVLGWDMQAVDNLGLLKLDVLGLSTLDIIADSIKLIKRRHNVDIDLNSLPLNDIKTYDLLADGKTIGIFQLEKQLGKTWSKRLKPQNISEVADLISILRPGPLESGMAEEYALVKSGSKMPYYVTKELKPILDPFYGGLIYQESVIETCKKLAGMSLVDSDLVRKAIGKKKPDELKPWKEKFINGCVANHITQSAAEEIWSYIDKHSGYSFNKSHGIGYALVSYYTAYLKANYPIEFFCANLRNVQYSQDTFDDINQFINDAKLFGFQILPPQLKYGNIDFDIISNDQIAFGLSFLKGVGDKGIQTAKLVYQNTATPVFDSFLMSAIKYKLNRRVMEALILSGAIDEYNISRTQMLARYNLLDALTSNEREIINNHFNYGWINIIRALADNARSQLMKNQWNVKIPNVRRRETLRELIDAFDSSNPFDSPLQKLGWEKEILGISLSTDTLRLFKSPYTCKDIINFADQDMKAELSILVEKVRTHLTKAKKQEMAFLTVSDHTGRLDNCVIFPNQWNMYKNLISQGNMLKIRGIISDKGSFIVNTLERLI